ncbi:MAG: 50S ribosomal protein L21 [Myxococcales bacterium]|nr:50S ribosomal protein L21 [Myxococcales bacterium]
MYAIIKTGGKQYRVSPGQTLRVEKLEGEPGEGVRLDQVLLLGGEGETRIGRPMLDGAAVDAEIVSQGKAKKIIIFKKRRRKGYHKKQGHRQRYTELRITGISA